MDWQVTMFHPSHFITTLPSHLSSTDFTLHSLCVSMDATLSSKTQTLISSLPASPSPLSSSSSGRFCFLHREFLGCGHRLRPPGGLHSRRKCKKSVFRIQPSRLSLRASLDIEPVFVSVAVATFSALTVVYFNYTQNKKKKNSKELSGLEDPHTLKNLEVTKQGTSFQKQSDESQNWDLSELNGDISKVRANSATEKINENDLLKGREVQYQNFSSSNQEIFTEEASGLHNSNNTLSMSNVATMEPEGRDLPPSQVSRKQDQLGSVIFGTGPQAKAKLSSNYLHTLGETIQDHKPDNEIVEASDIQFSGYNIFFKESDRKELHTFYEEDQSGVRSISNFRNLNSMLPSSHASAHSFSSLTKSKLNGAKLSAQVSHHTSVSVYQEGDTPLAFHKKESSGKRNEVNKGKGFHTDMAKARLSRNSQRDCPTLPQVDGKDAINKHDESEHLSIYNRLVREERLGDCIDLLELTEQRGLLDMNKIYHARFFNACKTLKAVKEAFRFTKLIGNPTLSTFNMLLSVCANSQDSEGAFQVLKLVKEARLKADCKLYTTLISTCGKSGKVDAMFEVFHEMVNAGVEPNLHTYGALIDGCARAGQVAKAFGAYGILRSKKVKPDRVVFNALITACGQSGAVDRAFDVLAEMIAEPTPVDPDHVTVGALIKTCAKAGQFDRAREVYKMIHQYKIKGTPEVYTIAVGSCSQTGDLEFALSVYGDMKKNGVLPDEMFFSSLVDVAGHAGKIDVAFDLLQKARNQGAKLGNVAYSSLMGACSNAKNWQKALELYEDIKSIKLQPTVPTLNALVTALCDGDQLQKAVDILTEMRKLGVRPNVITYTVLFIASDRKDEIEVGSMLHSQAKRDGIIPNLIMYRCLIGMCLRRFEKAFSLGEDVLSFNSGNPQIDNKWTSLALAIYREMIASGVRPTMEVFSLVLGCLQVPCDTSLRNRLIENLGLGIDASKCSNICSLIDGFGEYDPRSFSLLQEAASLGILPFVSFKSSPIIVDARKLQIQTAEVYLLTILKGLKHRLAAGAKLPNINFILPVDQTQVLTPKGEKTIKLVGRVGQAVGALLRRIGLPYQGDKSYGKIRINGISVKRWLQPKLAFPFNVKPEISSSPMRLAKGITDQQRNIRTSNLSLESENNSEENQR